MIPSFPWARARAASTSTQRARKASSPKTSRIGAVPNMSAKIAESRAPIAIAVGVRRPLPLTLPLRGSLPLPTRGQRAGARRRSGPDAVDKLLERRKPSLVGHFRAVGDPITEIDEGLPVAPAVLDEPQNAPGPEAAP